MRDFGCTVETPSLAMPRRAHSCRTVLFLLDQWFPTLGLDPPEWTLGKSEGSGDDLKKKAGKAEKKHIQCVVFQK